VNHWEILCPECIGHGARMFHETEVGFRAPRRVTKSRHGYTKGIDLSPLPCGILSPRLRRELEQSTDQALYEQACL
jgi:hypothetical protein